MMLESEQPLILVRLSPELTTKARGTRKRFTRQLVENIRDALRSAGVGFHVESQWTRIFVRTAAPDALEVLSRIPGISSASRVRARVPAKLDEIVRAGTECFADEVHGRSYAVRARRAGSHPFSSRDVQYALGAALNPGARVDLGNPDVEVEVEVRDEWAYFFSGRTEGLGGLPLAVEARALTLLSGGFDSAVAAWLMLKRGVEQDYVFCNLAGDAYERSVVQVGKVLADQWSYGTRPRLHVVDFGPPLDELRTKAQPRYWQLVLKRLMYRAAELILAELGASAVVTGESLGQVSSQTLVNLAATEDAVSIPVLRPLLGFDKREIVDLSRRIGTFELSSRVKEYCAISPGNPVTNASRAAAASEESSLDLSILERVVRERKVLDLRSIRAADLVAPYVFTHQVPEDAQLIDLRGEPEWEEWHHPRAVHRDYWELSSNLEGLDRNRTYVLYCDAGMQAAQIADQLQRRGVEAYAFKGGTRALRESIES